MPLTLSVNISHTAIKMDCQIQCIFLSEFQIHIPVNLRNTKIANIAIRNMEIRIEVINHNLTARKGHLIRISEVIKRK